MGTPRRRRRYDDWKKEATEARGRVRATYRCNCLDCYPLPPVPPDTPHISVRVPAVYFATGERIHE